MKRLWKLPWDNSYKEVYWKLLLDGLATSLRLHKAQQTCVCGALCPGRYHHFWQCPVAQAVVDAIIAEIPPSWVHVTPGVPVVTIANVWFMETPRAGVHKVHQGIWSVVCLAAIVAMDMGRAAVSQQYAACRAQSLWEQRQRAMLQRRVDRLHARHQRQLRESVPVWQPRIHQFLESVAVSSQELAVADVGQLLTPVQQHRSEQPRQQQRQHQQRSITDYMEHRPRSSDQHQAPTQQQVVQQPTVVSLTELRQLAVARFWELLADFTVLRVAPPRWLQVVSGSHPFLHPNDAKTMFVVERRN